MPMDPEKRRFLANVIGEEKTTLLEGSLATFSKDLEEHGIDWKEVGAVLVSESPASAEVETPPPAPAPEPAPEPVPAPEPEVEKPVVEEEVEKPSDLEELSGKVDALGSTVGQLSSTVGGLVTSMKALQQTDDEKVAAAMAPRKQEPQPAARATASKDNVVPDGEAAAIVESGGEDPNAPVNPVTPYIEQLKGLTPQRS